MWVLPVEAEHERARQADHVHEAAGRPDAQPGDRPEIGDDLADPALPQVPGQPLMTAPPAADLEDLGPEGRDQSEQVGPLVPDLVDQGGRDAAADHPLAGDADDRHGDLRAARQPGAGAADGGAQAAIQVADDRRGLVEAAGEFQRVGGEVVEAGDPDAGLVLAALGEDFREDLEVRDDRVERQAEHREAALGGIGPHRAAVRAPQPADLVVHHAAEPPPGADHVVLEGRLRRGRDGRRRDHRHLERERFEAAEPHEQRPGLVPPAAGLHLRSRSWLRLRTG